MATYAIQQDFGTDVSAYPDLDPSFSSISGNQVLSEMVIRRLTTERGSVVDDADFGFDVRDYLNTGSTGFTASPDQTLLYTIKAGIERELVKDQRVLAAAAVVTYNPNATATLPANCLHLVITISPAANNPFTLELAVTAVTLALLKTG